MVHQKYIYLQHLQIFKAKTWNNLKIQIKMEKDIEYLSRRDFSRLSATALGVIPLMSLGNILNYTPKASTTNDIEVHLFSKHLQFLNYNDMSEAAANLGFEGLDLTVRPEGHVLPERATDDLPHAVAAMKCFGLQSRIITTNITDTRHSESKNVLKIARNLGITHYRAGWLKYSHDKDFSEQIEEHSKVFGSLENISEELGLHGGYQNHVGSTLGLPISYIYQLLKMTTTKYMGSQYDIRHAMVIDGDNWEIGFEQVRPYINSIVIKDFKWGIKNGKKVPVNTPLGEGVVNFNRYFSLLKKYKINVPVSLHLEYDLGGAEQGAPKITMDKKEVFGQIKKDLTFLKETWKRAEP
ncbi:sugar phosphate isomerase/epimerase [Ulvibacterium marinum]|uniref:Sugar phosphate isomerase/epimerase n=2 Tax=Ulvibacterium marinum TaxID=2419782 RepID=A0A3B0C092_9FLAO|nr:sugar phosphate isomerase/epimerase [Ulvibacterium marinum]